MRRISARCRTRVFKQTKARGTAARARANKNTTQGVKHAGREETSCRVRPSLHQNRRPDGEMGVTTTRVPFRE